MTDWIDVMPTVTMKNTDLSFSITKAGPGLFAAHCWTADGHESILSTGAQARDWLRIALKAQLTDVLDGIDLNGDAAESDLEDVRWVLDWADDMLPCDRDGCHYVIDEPVRCVLEHLDALDSVTVPEATEVQVVAGGLRLAVALIEPEHDWNE